MKLDTIRQPIETRIRTTSWLGVLVILGPRLGFLLWWLLDPARWAPGFGNVAILTLLGCVVFPWATFVYAFVAAPGGLADRDWIWIGLALLLDLFVYDRGIWRTPSPQEAGK